MLAHQRTLHGNLGGLAKLKNPDMLLSIRSQSVILHTTQVYNKGREGLVSSLDAPNVEGAWALVR